jgi:hypothetical protein
MVALRARAASWSWCAALSIAWFVTLANVWGARAIYHPRGFTALVDFSFVLRPLVLVTMTVAFCLGIVTWTLRRAPVLGAAAGFLLLALLGHVENSLYEGDSGVHHGKLLPAAALMTWAIAWQLNRRRPVEEREETAYQAALGAAAACYVLAALAKLHSGGWDWVSTSNVPLLMAERAIGAGAWLGALRNYLASVGAGAGGVVLSSIALLIELFGVGLLWRQTQRWAASSLIALHLAIALLLGYVYVAWMLLLLGVLVRPPMAGQPARATSSP